jgi:hypothetical protein
VLESGHKVSCLGRQTLLSALTWRGKNEQVNGERELRKHPVGIETLSIPRFAFGDQRFVSSSLRVHGLDCTRPNDIYKEGPQVLFLIN